MDDPKQEVADHALRRDTSRGRELVRHAVVGGPDSGEHDGDALRAIGTLDPKPEHGQDRAGDDAEVAEVVTEARADRDREGDVESCPEGAVQYHWDSDARRAHDHDGDCITPVEPDRDDARCRLPRTQVDGVGRPVRHPGPQRPRLVLRRHGVHVGVGPYSRRRQGRVLLWKFPCFDSGAALLERFAAGNVLHDDGGLCWRGR